MKNILITTVLLFAFFQFSYGVNSLRVGDPRSTWYTYQGTIEEATLSIKPKGLYMEYGLYLTFSARNTPLSYNSDSLEAVLKFDLPANATIVDSWLWIGNDIIKAKILDKWSASSIYEGIVQRRMDPSILTKTSSTSYELRVFPMHGDSTRKVKITFLMPTNWVNNEVLSAIPLSILSTSLVPLQKLNVVTWADNTWTNPHFFGSANLMFYPQTDTILGSYFYTEIPNSMFSTSISAAFNSPVTNGAFLSTYSDGTDKYYQLAIDPKTLIDTIQGTNVAFLIDFHAANTNLSKATVIDNVKQSIYRYLSVKDSFNLIFSNFSIYRASNTWIPADSNSIENIFATFTTPLSDYSNLTSLLFNGIDFIVSHGNNGKIVLLSCSNQYSTSNVANSLVNDIVSNMDPDIPIHICDYQNLNMNYNYINGRYYYGNEYLYSNLSMITLGSFYRVYNTSYTLSDIIGMNLNEACGIINSFDLYTTATGGFCHSRYFLNTMSTTAYISNSIMQTGKFNGNLPFTAFISGEYKGNIFSKVVTFTSTDAFVGDTMSREIWAGLNIKDLESQTQTNNLISTIVAKSICERVLSKYSAFLCLEDTNQICNDCADESEFTEIETDTIAIDLELTAFPNPFTESVTIKINTTNSTDYSKATFKIFNIMGAEVSTFNYSDCIKNGYLEFNWNPGVSNELAPAGIYLFVMTTENATKSIKLIKQ